MMLNEAATAPAGELLEVMDALYRFGAGVDRNDGALLATAFSDDAVVDFGPCGRKMGLDFPVLTGGEAIVGFLCANAQTQTTSHVITNGRAQVDGDAGRLRALVDATHLPKDDHSRRCQMMNWYEVDLVKDGNMWRIRRLVISNAWFTGDIQVLLGN
jgi:SnoaL-like domain